MNKMVKLIQVPSGDDPTQQSLLLLAIQRIASRTPCLFILSFLGHEQLDEHNLGFLLDAQDVVGQVGRVGVTGFSETSRCQFADLNLNIRFPCYRLEAIPSLTKSAVPNESSS